MKPMTPRSLGFVHDTTWCVFDETGEIECELDIRIEGSWCGGDPEVGARPGVDDFTVTVKVGNGDYVMIPALADIWCSEAFQTFVDGNVEDPTADWEEMRDDRRYDEMRDDRLTGDD